MPIITRRTAMLWFAALGSMSARLAFGADSVLPSWRDSLARQAIIRFVQDTTDKSSPRFVPPEERIATFDQDGTLWVEHPACARVMSALELSNQTAAIGKFFERGWAEIVIQ